MPGVNDFWGDLSAIAGVVGGVVAVAALVLSIVNYVQARETRVIWAVEAGHNDSSYRIRNTSARLTAFVITVNDGYFGEVTGRGDSAIYALPALPIVIEPQNWIPISAHQILNRERLRITIEWHHQRDAESPPRPRVHRAKVFL